MKEYSGVRIGEEQDCYINDMVVVAEDRKFIYPFKDLKSE